MCAKNYKHKFIIIIIIIIIITVLVYYIIIINWTRIIYKGKNIPKQRETNVSGSWANCTAASFDENA